MMIKILCTTITSHTMVAFEKYTRVANYAFFSLLWSLMHRIRLPRDQRVHGIHCCQVNIVVADYQNEDIM